MTAFTTSSITQAKIFTIINVGSYKTRAIIASFDGDKMAILGYGEKRQSRLDIVNNKVINTSGLCETISEAIIQAQGENSYPCENLIINPFFSSVFFFSKKFAHKRTNSNNPLSNSELQHIMKRTQSMAQTSVTHELSQKYGISINDVSNILNYAPTIHIDGKQLNYNSPTYGEDVNIQMLHCYIPKENHKIISDIAHFLGKNIIHIIPEEYSLTLIDQENSNSIYINIGNTSTLISIKEVSESITGSIRIEIGIENLIKQIAQKSKKNRSEIIKKLDREDLFVEEKKVFLTIFTQFIAEGLKEILGTRICPAHCVISGGGAHNDFISRHLSQVHFVEFGVKCLGNIEVIRPSIESIKHIQGVDTILSPSTISILGQVLTTSALLQKKHIS